MSTRELAEKLNALEILCFNKRTHNNNNNNANANGNYAQCVQQPFDYLFVMDFEATCWEKYKRPAEIIEFSVVLHDVNKGKIVDEFQKYVMPTENPILSEFCKKLTGIQQEQVDKAVTILPCLHQFDDWLEQNLKKYNMCFPNKFDLNKKKCIFVTWSDWDLGTCLKKECERKRIHFKNIYHQWIDLRAAYQRRYRHPPNGLMGALTELKLKFEGKEHCGLDDAKNTARLAARMMEQGTVLDLNSRVRF